MPKETFFNLNFEKREKITKYLRFLYESKPFSEVSVKEIVNDLGIARGSFYQYFENLEESYFMILEKDTTDIHSLFLRELKEKNFHLYEALRAYGASVSKLIFHSGSYQIYKNRYLYWNDALEKGWIAYQKKHAEAADRAETLKIGLMSAKKEEVHFIKAVVHDLVKRIFTENWTEAEFLEHYQSHMNFIEKGVSYGNR